MARIEAARDIASDPEFGSYFDPDFAEELFAAVVDVPLPAFEDTEVLAA
ncbi:hypothetical protein [Murinocardiopsis flavida]|nr:hypothetical protein [Murinocardiopsis flavida]